MRGSGALSRDAPVIGSWRGIARSSGCLACVLGAGERGEELCSRRFSRSQGVKSRDISGCLLSRRWWHWRMACYHLLVDVGQFATRIFKEELPLDGVDGCKNIREHSRNAGEDHAPVLAIENESVRDEELELAHEPEGERQQDGNRDDERVGNHFEPRERNAEGSTGREKDRSEGFVRDRSPIACGGKTSSTDRSRTAAMSYASLTLGRNRSCSMAWIQCEETATRAASSCCDQCLSLRRNRT